jgi:hypothetical protein
LNDIPGVSMVCQLNSATPFPTPIICTPITLAQTRQCLYRGLALCSSIDYTVLFHPEEGDNTFHGHIGSYVPNYTASHPKGVLLIISSFANRSLDSSVGRMKKLWPQVQFPTEARDISFLHSIHFGRRSPATRSGE